MVKFSAITPDGRPAMGFGLSAQNLKRLKAGQPIKIDGAQAGLPFAGDILIFYGRSEHDMLEESSRRLDSLSRHLGPDTQVHIDPRSL
jgi:hypothetical protein